MLSVLGWSSLSPGRSPHHRRLAHADAIDGGPHVVKDAAARNTAQHEERLGRGVEQHFMGLQQCLVPG